MDSQYITLSSFSPKYSRDTKWQLISTNELDHHVPKPHLHETMIIKHQLI